MMHIDMTRGMKILITGRPAVGKSTLLAKLLANCSLESKHGFLTEEVRDEEGARVGFSLLSDTEETISLARIDKPTTYPVGKYYVDLVRFEAFLKSLELVKPESLLYLDEIGQMQLLSPQFKELVEKYLDADNHFIGTITSVYKDEFVENIKSRRDVLTCEITPDNRVELEKGLGFALEHRELIADLSKSLQRAIIDMATAYLENEEYTYFKKLFKNAVPYVAEGKIIELAGGGFEVAGSTGSHRISVSEDESMACDCDLFNGRGKFEGKAGECSHIQTALLASLL